MTHFTSGTTTILIKS